MTTTDFFDIIVKKCKKGDFKMHLFFKTLSEYMPDIAERFNPSDEQTEKYLDEIEDIISEKLPQSFRDLYSEYDGECEYTSSVMGTFSLLSAGDILGEIKTYKDLTGCDFEYTTSDKGIIMEKDMCDMMLVPFANDGSGCCVAVDLNPDINGTKGQIIAVDIDSQKYYLIAESFDKFCDIINQMHKSGDIEISDEEEDVFFQFKDGHILDNAEENLKKYRK